MRRRVAFVVLAVCLNAAPDGSRFARAQPLPIPPFETLLAAYAAGDRDVVSKTLTNAADFLQFDASLTKALKPTTPPREWDRNRAAFLLEIAIVASLKSKSDVLPVISAGRLMVTGRPAPIGRDAADDAFEREWHTIALAVLQRGIQADAEEVYLDTLERRYGAAPPGAATAGAPQPAMSPRFVLDRAIADEQSVWQAQGPPNARSTRLTPLVKPGDKSKLATLVTSAIADCDEAVALPDVEAEARIRGAALRITGSRFDEALTLLRRVDAMDVDDIQRYWGTLLEARALHELKRLPEAESAYRAAAVTWPGAPSPAVGIALVLFDMNRRDEAVKAAAEVRAMPTTGADPWWSYMIADARFINRWRDSLRGMLR